MYNEIIIITEQFCNKAYNVGLKYQIIIVCFLIWKQWLSWYVYFWLVLKTLRRCCTVHMACIRVHTVILQVNNKTVKMFRKNWAVFIKCQLSIVCTRFVPCVLPLFVRVCGKFPSKVRCTFWIWLHVQGNHIPITLCERLSFPSFSVCQEFRVGSDDPAENRMAGALRYSFISLLLCLK